MPEGSNQTEKRIVEFAFLAFGQKGFKAMTLDLVAKELHISKKTIYKFFRTKEELLEKSFDFQFEQLESRLEAIPLEASGGFTSFHTIANLFLNFHSSFPFLLRNEISQEIPHLDERVNMFESLSFKKRISRLLKALRTEGLVSYPSPTREFTDSFCQALHGMAGLNAAHFDFILKSFFRGISIKEKKKKKKGK